MSKRGLWTKKQKIKFSKIMVVLVLSQAFLYTWAHLILSYFVGMEISPTATCAFYAFCGTEAGLLAWIKKFDKSDSSDENNNFDLEENTYERDFSTEVDEP